MKNRAPLATRQTLVRQGGQDSPDPAGDQAAEHVTRVVGADVHVREADQRGQAVEERRQLQVELVMVREQRGQEEGL